MKFTAYDNLPCPIFIADPNGRLTYVNHAWREYLGSESGELWTKPFDDVQQTDLRHAWKNCCEADESFTITSKVSSASGIRWYDIQCQAIDRDEAGEMGVLGTLQDVTAQTLVTAATLAILDTAVDAIIIIDQDGIIDTFNQAAVEMFGYQTDEIIGQSVTKLMPEPHRSQHEVYIERYLATGNKKIIGIGRELEAVDKAGNKIPIHLAVSEIDIEGQRRFTGIIRDLSEQRADREALAEHRQRLAHVDRLSSMGEMTASIAHEINQPLTAISMYAQAGIKLIERGNTDLEKLQSALDKLNTQSLRAGAVIERIQRFARAQESQREIMDVNELVIDLVKLTESDAHLHDIELVLDLGEALPTRFGDPIQIQQVALNLIRNAIDAMNEIHCANGRSITIRTRLAPQDLIVVSVSDLGPGVAEEQADLVFTPFHTTKKDGMGMGLSICRSIIAEHGGSIDFYNNDDAGATFFFNLPEVSTDE